MALHEFFLLLAVVLLGARLLSEAAARLGIPSVIGELAAGLILGPSLLGWVSVNETLEILADSAPRNAGQAAARFDPRQQRGSGTRHN